MVNQELLGKIRKSLRISHTKLDDEIAELIEAAKLDLKISGVIKIDEADPLIIRAISLYAKSASGYFEQMSERYEQSYKMLKISLALVGDYNQESIN